ncbi:SMI1/KNR4 family protein [Streptomyces sp. NPDC004539]|uniref:SMI1/KNR4 family protein n=1 Tax=Streptomyces sp. NPDC004539 TaxID=3154280 RepID=UPI0033A2DF3C
MEHLIGTQHPPHRLTDPAETITVLEAAVPGLLRHRRTAPEPPDWARIEGALGLRLPPDFRLLAELYPTFVLAGFLHVPLPAPAHESRWLDGVDHELEIVRDWWEDGSSIGLSPHPAPGGLLPWASSYSGDVFLWTTDEPWRVTVASRNLEWWHYSGGAVQFVAEWVSGGLEPWALPELGAAVQVFR